MAGSVRQPIDLQALEKYIEKHVPEIKIPIGIKQFGFGQSNPTYQLLAANGQKYVMRKKPPGKLVSKTAHQVEREYRVIHALEKTDVPVPKAYCLCEDEEVIGTPFYIMEFLDGRIIEDPGMPGVSAKERRAMWHDAIRTLAKLHRVNISEAGLTSFGKSAGFYDRQIKTFGTISEAQASTVDIETKEPVGQIPHIEEILRFFRDRKFQPKDRAALVHGDYKIDNLVFHKTEPRVIGILDWEMSTIGHPLSDIINILSPYSVQHEKKFESLPQFQEDHLPGLPSQSDLISWYRETAGWDPEPDLPWGMAFGFFRNTCIYQGIAARWAVRQASSAKAEVHAKARWPMGDLCWKFVGLAKERKGAEVKAKL
ncbi:hypothetical protein MFRU_031g00050 [Monilinia fructicola]|uniref:Aminoglycoside phosphotransferase domain-containing protein n=1 Tax=Monilinia fructicola TaxID=38448 RepID=A0A5M9JPF8_MONFR|nr:hypothetical protein EYC84_002844 [Monilinia fructicola]KAG4027255.1 hypothetical protein MFRU_031g00050 [Monilinia fructicola]